MEVEVASKLLVRALAGKHLVWGSGLRAGARILGVMASRMDHISCGGSGPLVTP
jgi:hypothetical protein